MQVGCPHLCALATTKMHEFNRMMGLMREDFSPEEWWRLRYEIARNSSPSRHHYRVNQQIHAFHSLQFLRINKRTFNTLALLRSNEIKALYLLSAITHTTSRAITLLDSLRRLTRSASTWRKSDCIVRAGIRWNFEFVAFDFETSTEFFALDLGACGLGNTSDGYERGWGAVGIVIDCQDTCDGCEGR